MVNKLSANVSGQFIKIGRPDYTIVDNTPTILFSGSTFRYRVEKGTRNYVQAEVRDPEFYTIFGDRTRVRPGDLIIPQEATTLTSTPVVTVLSVSPLNELMGFRTNRIGKITNGDLGDIFTTVYYEETNDPFPGRAINTALESSLDIPNKKFVMYNRALATSTRDVEGLMLIESGSAVSRRWLIKQVLTIGNILILTCSEGVSV